MATEERGGVVDGIRVDVRRLHETWMELLFPRQRGAEHSVLGKWKPTTQGDRIKYRVWAALGVPLIAVLYPLMLVGLATRFYARRFDSIQARIGLVGVVFLLVLLWGALTALARVRFDQTGFLAVLAASVTAIVSAILAVTFTRVGGRATTVFLAYPFGMTAVLLPPVVAALYSPTVGEVVFTRSTTLAKWLLNNVLDVGGLDDYLRSTYDLEGVAYVLMWFGIAVPLGWLLGLLVTLANLARPTGEDDEGSGKSNDTSGQATGGD